VWLDLPALSGDLGLGGGSALIQSLHLAALLAERDAGDAVALQTSELMAERRPGERTFRRLSFDNAHLVVRAIRGLGPDSPRPRTSSGPSRHEVVERLRARAEQAPASRGLLPVLEASLFASDQPPSGPLADPELWVLETRLSQGETIGILEELDAIERRRGRLPGTAYLRARAELWLHPEEPLQLAERISALSTSMPAFHELELLAAQAWAAAGFVRRAKAFARDLFDNATASETIRLQARLVLDDLEGKSSGRPAPLARGAAGTPLGIPRAPRAPTGLEVGPALEARSLDATPEPRPRRDPTPQPRSRDATRSSRPASPLRPAETLALATRTSDKAPTHASSVPAPTPTPALASAPRLVDAERLETLSLPAGLQGMPIPALDEPPRAPPAARLAFTFLARELGRELRLRHGVELETNVDGLEIAQRYLRERLADGRVRSREDERELMRNGAFLSELLARRLGAFWVDLESTDSARWTMLVPAAPPVQGMVQASLDGGPPEPTRVWPFARVLRFVAMGHKERDLVSYYLELEARSRLP
jgi:hypothetical protein